MDKSWLILTGILSNFVWYWTRQTWTKMTPKENGDSRWFTWVERWQVCKQNECCRSEHADPDWENSDKNVLDNYVLHQQSWKKKCTNNYIWHQQIWDKKFQNNQGKDNNVQDKQG